MRDADDDRIWLSFECPYPDFDSAYKRLEEKGYNKNDVYILNQLPNCYNPLETGIFGPYQVCHGSCPGKSADDAIKTLSDETATSDNDFEYGMIRNPRFGGCYPEGNPGKGSHFTFIKTLLSILFGK